MSCFTTPQLTGAAAAYFDSTTRQDGMTSTRPPLAPLDPFTLRPQVSLKHHHSPPTVPLYSAAECLFSPDSPDSPLAIRSRRVPALMHRTPLAHHRTLPLQGPTQCRSAEQDDIDEIMRFLKRVSRCMTHVYQVILSVATLILYATIATVQWFAVVAFVIEVMMMSSPSVRGDHGGGFIGPIVEQLTTSTATSYVEITPSLHPLASEAAALNFLSEQIDQAHNVLTLVEGLGDDAFFAYHHANVQRFLSRSRDDPPPGGSKTEVDPTVNFRGLDSTLFQTLSPHGFIGRTISHALDEVTYHSKRSQTAFLIRRSAIRESRLDSVYLLASSNLLLEYSSILSKMESIILDVGALHHHLSRNLPEVLQSRQAATSRRSIWGIFASRRLNSRAVEEESLEAFVAGLETVLVNLRQLKAYLEWITNQLSQRTLLSSVSTALSSSNRSCSSALMDLLDRASRASKKSRSRCCRCPDSGKDDSPTAPARVEFNIPGSRTLPTVS
ncbi:uncharacterized protein BJ212DRAFT_1475739 [Suillus subaureus]|uniref:Uncharacterized protein n=1 Tax=Suillus subaureus TaxID=48587 RepID=A0A9P7EK68_9AGAM|nr:uncharacterized protein BJ212DRAFT_1475739 [Suillus subaureus]KAG1824437.1 hypothetical protein BJ212DRAFT_1475739 [Suillus subaureus]